MNNKEEFSSQHIDMSLYHLGFFDGFACGRGGVWGGGRRAVVGRVLMIANARGKDSSRAFVGGYAHGLDSVIVVRSKPRVLFTSDRYLYPAAMLPRAG